MPTLDDSCLEDSSFPMIGGSISLLVSFVEENGGSAAFNDLTTDDVKNRFVLPATAKTQQSMCQQLQASGDSRIGRPSWFVSHAWKYSFLHLLQVPISCTRILTPTSRHVSQALCSFFLLEPGGLDTIVWLDLFSTSQHATFDRPPLWYARRCLHAAHAFTN